MCFRIFKDKVQIRIEKGHSSPYTNVWEDDIPFLEKAIKKFKKRRTKNDFKYKRRLQKMAYKEINPEIWMYENDGEFIEGILVLKQVDVGDNKSMMYSIETPEGVKNVWGSAILDSRMKLVKEGSKVKITYKGLGEAKGGHNPPKIFKVEVDE